jgi:uncharacterized protein YndB with AHSA1/START domain
MNAPFVIERTLKAPITKVWKAITNKDEMKRWYFDIAEFKPEVGFEFRFSGGDENKQYLHVCRITEVIHGKKIAYTWQYPGYGGNSKVTFELFEEGQNQTKIKLTHEGLETFPKDNPNFAKESFAEGWTHIIGKLLKEHVESE